MTFPTPILPFSHLVVDRILVVLRVQGVLDLIVALPLPLEHSPRGAPCPIGERIREDIVVDILQNACMRTLACVALFPPAYVMQAESPSVTMWEKE